MRAKFLAPVLTVGLLASGNASSGVITAASDDGTLGSDTGEFSIDSTLLSASSEVPYFNIADSYLLAWKVVVEVVRLDGSLSLTRTDETQFAFAEWAAHLSSPQLPPPTLTDSQLCRDDDACDVLLEYPTPQEITGFNLADVVGVGSYKVDAEATLVLEALANLASSSSLMAELTVFARSEYTYCVSDDEIDCAATYGDAAVYVPREESRVPVPATAALLALGLAGLQWGRRQPHSS